jgi:glycosyltransferase involved in cell wall biosynthesis
MDNLKSVLYVLPATAVGGAETKFFNVIEKMTDFKSILLANRSVAGYFSIPGLKVYLFEEYGCREPMPVSLKNALNYAKAITDVVKKEKADCMMGIMHTGSFYASLARDIFRLKVPLIGTIEGNISAFFGKEERSPTLLEKSLLWYLLRRPLLLSVPSEGVRDDLVKNFGISAGRITLIYNGIDIDSVREMAAEGSGIADGYHGKTIVTACRLNAQKDFLTLLRAFREVRNEMDSRLVIVGDGELRGEITKSAQDLGIGEHVVITGFQNNPFGYFKAADVFVLSSFFEGFGNVIVEAMALGVPVVATDCPSGPREIMRNGINGFLVPMQDHHAMAESILRLLQNDNLRYEVAVKGRERAECFKVENMIESFKRLITRVC